MKTLRSDPVPSIDPPEAAIQHTAHRLWLEAGRPADRDLDLWLRAKETLRHRATRSTPLPDDTRTDQALTLDPL